MKTKIFLAGLIFLVLVGCRKKPSADDYKYYEPKDKEEVVDTIDTLAEVADSVVVEKISEKPIKKEIKAVNLDDDKFFIVVASYAIEDYAKEQKVKLCKQGYKAEIFELDNNGWYKLAVLSYKTFGEAKAALEQLKKEQGIFSQARIVQKK